MSWKSFVTAGLLCIVASPVFAAPTVQIIPGGTFANNHLNAAGDWVWLVRLSQSNPIVDVDDGGPLPEGSPLGAELGFSELTGELLSAALVTETNGFGVANGGQANPGNPIFGTFSGGSYTGWETISDTDGDTTVEFNGDDEPVGLQTSTAFDQIFAALGSGDYLSDPDGKGFITIVVDGPNAGPGGILSTSLQMLGAYGGNGRIAELNPDYDGDGDPPFSLNFDTYSGTFTRTALGGNANLDGIVDDGDLNIVLSNFNDAGTPWYLGNMNGDNVTDDGDLNLVLSNFNDPNAVGPGAGGGSGGGGAVPEPATMAMVALAGLGLLGLRRRHS